MTKISKRLEIITKYIDKKDVVIDVGCDHGLLSIFLTENKLCKKVLACDINQNALDNAIKNISIRNLDIKTYLSDGINDVPLKGVNTLVISGMGTTTILHILKDADKLKNINKLVIQSNNDWELLRKELNNKGYYLEDEDNTFDKGKWYITSLFVKSNKKNTNQEIEFGYLKNNDYCIYLLDNYRKINRKIPLLSFKDKINIIKKIKRLKATIKNK